MDHLQGRKDTRVVVELHGDSATFFLELFRCLLLSRSAPPCARLSCPPTSDRAASEDGRTGGDAREASGAMNLFSNCRHARCRPAGGSVGEDGESTSTAVGASGKVFGQPFTLVVARPHESRKSHALLERCGTSFRTEASMARSKKDETWNPSPRRSPSGAKMRGSSSSHLSMLTPNFSRHLSHRRLFRAAPLVARSGQLRAKLVVLAQNLAKLAPPVAAVSPRSSGVYLAGLAAYTGSLLREVASWRRRMGRDAGGANGAGLPPAAAGSCSTPRRRRRPRAKAQRGAARQESQGGTELPRTSWKMVRCYRLRNSRRSATPSRRMAG